MIPAARRTIGLAPVLIVAISAGIGATPAASSSPGTSASGPAPLPPIDCPADAPLASGSIATIAGGGLDRRDGGQALDAHIDVTVGGVAVEDDGAVLFNGYYEPRVRRVGVDGILSPVGDPTAGGVHHFSALALDRSGNVFMADRESARIWRIDLSGKVSAYAGNGSADSAGDDGPALEAALAPYQVATGPDGSVYLDDGPRFRVITTDGTIHAFAGTGTSGFSGDGGPALDAQVGGTDTADESYAEVMGMAMDAAGDLYVADTGNQRIRKVDRDGTITTFAGNGQRGYTGDGGPAPDATFQDPVDVALDAAGNLYISDHHNRVVRRVDTNGVISTVAGFPGGATSSGDCGPATEAGLLPWSIDVRDGYLYIGDMTVQADGLIRVVRL